MVEKENKGKKNNHPKIKIIGMTIKDVQFLSIKGVFLFIIIGDVYYLMSYPCISLFLPDNRIHNRSKAQKIQQSAQLFQHNPTG